MSTKEGESEVSLRLATAVAAIVSKTIAIARDWPTVDRGALTYERLLRCSTLQLNYASIGALPSCRPFKLTNDHVGNRRESEE